MYDISFATERTKMDHKDPLYPPDIDLPDELSGVGFEFMRTDRTHAHSDLDT